MSKIIYSINSLNKILLKEKPSKVCIVTSDILIQKMDWMIKEIKFENIEIILIPDGEKAKGWNELEKLLIKFSQLNIDRNSIVIALGGGTVGDLTGFASSIYLRGIRYIQIPTTLLAQVDSAHGGKTGINFNGFKNQIGTFSMPIATVVDIRVLKYLSEDQIADGLGEVIKAGLIKDKSIISILKNETLSSIKDSSILEMLVRKSINVKLYYTKKDYEENTVRQILNAGHTIGHAIELKYKISHGKAVILGLIQELQFTESLGLSNPTIRKDLLTILKDIGIDVDLKMKADWSSVVHDKKVIGKTIMFPIIEKIGKSKIISLNLNSLKQFTL